MKVTIKQADIHDLDRLIEWRMEVLHEVFSIPKEQETGELEKANRNYYHTMLKNGGHIACFAYCKDEIVGCGGICIYREMPSPDNPSGCCAYLMNIYTRPQYRGQGIGKKVVSWLIQQAREKGITKIYLETSECGYSLYREMGFTDMHGYMQIKDKPAL